MPLTPPKNCSSTCETDEEERMSSIHIRDVDVSGASADTKVSSNNNDSNNGSNSGSDDDNDIRRRRNAQENKFRDLFVQYRQSQQEQPQHPDQFSLNRNPIAPTGSPIRNQIPTNAPANQDPYAPANTIADQAANAAAVNTATKKGDDEKKPQDRTSYNTQKKFPISDGEYDSDSEYEYDEEALTYADMNAAGGNPASIRVPNDPKGTAPNQDPMTTEDDNGKNYPQDSYSILALNGPRNNKCWPMQNICFFFGGLVPFIFQIYWLLICI
jgi:hypothetical protein